MIDSILLPTDGSDCARTATAHAAAIARAYDATVHVLTVVEAVADDVTQAQRDRVRSDRVEPTLADLEAAGVDATDAVAEGIPVDAILRAADERDADVIAIGTHGRSGLRRHLLGSVTERVIRQSTVPVLAVPEAAGRDPAGAPAEPYEDVLLPTDGSEGAAAVRPLAFELAGTFEATLHALSVVDTRLARTDVGATVVVEEFEAISEDAVEDLAAAAREAGLERVVTAVLEGAPTGLSTPTPPTTGSTSSSWGPTAGPAWTATCWGASRRTCFGRRTDRCSPCGRRNPEIEAGQGEIGRSTGPTVLDTDGDGHPESTARYTASAADTALAPTSRRDARTKV